MKLFTSNFLRDLQTRTSQKSWRRVSPSSITDRSRHDTNAVFCLFKGKDYLVFHMQLIGISTDFICPFCDSRKVMERDHQFRYGALYKPFAVSKCW
ncbi:RNase H domain-containing protein [Nephila pilipes]|uniref:RNase H domain-containing protein n=1 Tax=Nephila pilipes TaxID=299642 RepID=A0A8X6U680_NEPPI|nr:RNase H domain-containing protein [Nephila pilipes]